MDDSLNSYTQPRSPCMTAVCRMYAVVQNFAIAGLTAGVILLFFQQHKLQSQLNAEDAKITELLNEIQSQQESQQDLNEKITQEHNITIYQMAGTLTLLTCILTAFHMSQHLSNFQQVLIQRKIIAILWMSPIYSITSFLGLVFPQSDGYLAVLKDFYEAYVIYNFLSFLICVIGRGDRQTAIEVLAKQKEHLKTPTKCLSSCYHPRPETSDFALAAAVLAECQILAMQFVLVRPVTSILQFVVSELYESENAEFYANPSFYISMITNVSVFFAFNGLLKFYHAVQQDLRWCKPFMKFMSIKGVVFLTFWQGLAISILFSLPGRTASPAAGGPPPPSHHVHHAPSMVPPPTPHPTSIEGATIDLLEKNGTGHHRLLDVPSEQHDISLWQRYLEEDTTRRHQQEQEEEEKTSHEKAQQLQNFLIVLEMLFFSIMHYCVFPPEEWEADYRPRELANPGIGLKDFVGDLNLIMSTSRNRRVAYQREMSESEADDGTENDHEIL